jgi:hypothetical protein
MAKGKIGIKIDALNSVREKINLSPLFVPIIPGGCARGALLENRSVHCFRFFGPLFRRARGAGAITCTFAPLTLLVMM